MSAAATCCGRNATRTQPRRSKPPIARRGTQRRTAGGGRGVCELAAENARASRAVLRACSSHGAAHWRGGRGVSGVCSREGAARVAAIGRTRRSRRRQSTGRCSVCSSFRRGCGLGLRLRRRRRRRRRSRRPIHEQITRFRTGPSDTGYDFHSAKRTSARCATRRARSPRAGSHRGSQT